MADSGRLRPEMEPDPYASLIKHCMIDPSQEQKLQNCPLARQFETFPDTEPDDSFRLSETEDHVDPTGIVMVSLPDSPTNEDEEFQTPPENSRSQLSSSEEQRPPSASAAIDPDTDLRLEAAGEFFSSSGAVMGGGTDTQVNGNCADGEKTVDLGRDSDNLGFSEPKLAQEIGAGCVVSCVDSSRGVKRVGVSEIMGSESDNDSQNLGSKKIRVSEGNLDLGNQFGSTEPVVIEADEDEDTGVKAIELDTEPIDECLGIDASKVCDELPVGRGGKSDEARINGEGITVDKRIEDIEKFRYVGRGESRGGGAWGRRELPPSMKGQDKDLNKGKRTWNLFTNQKALDDILDALKMAEGKANDDDYEEVDILETVMKRGISFPRPSSWPLDGFAYEF